MENLTHSINIDNKAPDMEKVMSYYVKWGFHLLWSSLKWHSYCSKFPDHVTCNLSIKPWLDHKNSTLFLPICKILKLPYFRRSRSRSIRFQLVCVGMEVTVWLLFFSSYFVHFVWMSYDCKDLFMGASFKEKNDLMKL